MIGAPDLAVAKQYEIFSVNYTRGSKTLELRTPDGITYRLSADKATRIAESLLKHARYVRAQ